MNIYLYAACNAEYADKIRDALEDILDQGQIFLLPGDFPACAYLNFDMRSGDVMIIIPKDKQQLGGLLMMKELLQDFQLILILPDEDEETVRNAHMLMPRFLSFIENDMEEILNVLRRMTTQ